MRRTLMFMLFFWASAHAEPIELQSQAPADLWFKPMLTIDSAPLCGSLTPIVDRWFVTSKGPGDLAL
ncbi:TPA: hypothetical protein ACIE75_005520, partial [Klebsiella pneumoniae]